MGRPSPRSLVPWCLLLATGACQVPAEALGPLDGGSGSSSGSSDAGTRGSSTTDATTSTGPVLDDGTSSSSSGDPPATGTSTSEGSSTTSSTGGSESSESGEPLPQCGDGQVAADELCHILGPAIVVAPAPGRLALGDLDLDTHVDLVLANPLSPMLTVLLGVGDGNFIAPQPLLNAGAVVDDLVLVDLSDDGALDLVVTDRLGSRVVSFANDGTGVLFFAGQYPAELAPVRLAAGELDGDGVPDLVALAVTSAAVMHGNGLAGVIPQQQITLLAGPHAPGLFDVSLDGQLDLVTVNQSAGNVTCWLDAGGMLEVPAIEHDTAATPSSLAMGDIDGDGDLDLLLVHTSADDLGVLLGDGMGALGPESLIDVADDPRAVALADLDSDGTLDLAITHGTPGLLVLYRGVGDGTFMEGPGHAMSGPADLYVDDLDADGVPDLVVTRPADAAVQVLLSDP